MCAMPSKLWILVKWIDESSNVISFYGVVKVDTHLLKKTGLHPGQITLLRVNKNVRRAKILRISESKDDVADQKRILENKEDQMVDLVKLLTSIVGQQNAEREAFQKNKDRHDRLQKRLSYLKKLIKLKQQMKKKELDKRNDSNDSSSDSEASVKKDDTELGNSSKCTSKPTRSTFKAKKLSHRRSANNSTPLPSTSAQEDINDTPQYKHQQSNTKQTLGTLKENNLSHQSANSGTPIPSTSAQEDINDTPQYKHQQSNTKQTRSTFKAKKLKHRRSANNGTLLPSTSTKEDINDSPQYKHQQSTRKQTRGTLKENNLRHRSDNSSTPSSSSAQEDIEYTPKYKHKKSTCKQKRHQQSNSKHTPATLKENNLIHQSDNSRLPIPNISTQEEIDDAPQYKDQQSTRKLTRVPVSSLDYLNSQLHRVRQNFNKLLPLADISKWEDIPSMSELEPDTEAPNSEQNVGETEPNNKDNEKVRAEKVTDNNSIEVGVEETMDTNDNEKVDAEEVIQNNYNEKVSAEEVNKENEEGGAERVIPNKDNKAVGVEEVIKIDDDPEFDAEEVTENNDNGEVNAEEIIENEEVGAEEVIENSDNEEFDEENEIENNYNEEVGAEEVKENNYIYNGEEQQASISTVNEQISKPATLQVRRMSAQTTNNIIINMIPIGYGNTKVPEKVLRDIDWRSYTQATRKLLKAVFPQSVLATHSLTGKPSPAFVGKPAKEILDPTHVEDIVYTVTRNCGVTKKMVRSCITLKCTEEARGLRNRMQSKIARKSQDENDENMSPYGSSSDD
ncbi:hypothetical protein PYW08_005131 [Mythimna loreyi]|uniref:Uncharacterized protein n=1 Tax=Mythimna loreyi TaxID=667449 RepID=A0ACC2QEP7_9NEOP|nr:hypothetical protein PYW08_005131 [Mythimna loreyi]